MNIRDNRSYRNSKSSIIDSINSNGSSCKSFSQKHINNHVQIGVFPLKRLVGSILDNKNHIR